MEGFSWDTSTQGIQTVEIWKHQKRKKKLHWHDLSICSPLLRGKGSLVTFIHLITCEKMKEFCMCSMHFLFTSFWELQPFEPLTLHLPVARMKTAENNRIAWQLRESINKLGLPMLNRVIVNWNSVSKIAACPFRFISNCLNFKCYLYCLEVISLCNSASERLLLPNLKCWGHRKITKTDRINRLSVQIIMIYQM